MHVAIPSSIRPPLLAALLLVSAGTPLALGADGPRPGPAAQVVSEGPRGLVLKISIPSGTPREVTVPGAGAFWTWDIPGLEARGGAPSGTPDLPLRGFPFGLPDRATARIASVRILASGAASGRPPLPAPTVTFGPPDPGTVESQTVSYEPNPAAYAASSWVPASTVELGPVFGYRHQRVQSLIVHPVRAIPSTGAYETVQELEVEIRFESTGPASARRRVPVVRDAPGWDEDLDRVLVNPTSARTFRARSEPGGIPSGAIAAGATYVRVRIGDSGLCRIPYADLVAAGWPVGVSVGNVRVEERGYNGTLADPFTVLNLPRLVEDTDGNGMFNAGDYLVFYGMNYKDRFKPLFFDARYSFFHTYWVTDAAAGADYPEVDGYPAGTGYAVMDSFPQINIYEKNLIYINNPLDSGSSSLPIYDTDYWLPSDSLNTVLPFVVQDLAPGTNYRVRARWQGKDTVVQTRTHIVSLDLNGTQIMPEQTFFDRFPLQWDGPFLPAAGALSEGANTVTVHAHTANPDVTKSGCYFDWYEVTYGRRLNARGNLLAFNTGSLTGKREIAITGFTAPDVFVLDVTDPTAPFRLTPDVVNAGTSWTARIRVDLGAGGATRQYVAAIRSSVVGLPPTTHPIPPDLGTAAIAAGLPRDLLTAGDGSDYILITHPTLEAAWGPLVDYRNSRGHQVFLCNVWEIYDQFAGGDKTPWAIQRFLTQAFRRWDPSPSYLLLGGDGSEDYRGELSTSEPDWVPTLMAFGDVGGSAGLELSGTDPWYVDFLAEGDNQFDPFPDMHLSRIPAGTPAEVQASVQKIIAYEDMKPGDAWRSRGFFLSDDQYSSGIFQSVQYCYQSGEAVFRNTTNAVCDSIRVLAGLDQFRSQKFFLADYLDTVAALGRDPGNSGNCPLEYLARNYTRANVTSTVLDSLSRGWLLWEFTGHANRNQITHEALIYNLPNSSSEDVARFNNIGKPFVFMGYACHIMEFESATEKTSGKSIGEYLLLAPNRGAIAVMAAPSYELLPTNPLAQRYTSRALFWDLPRDPATGRPRRIFSDCTYRGLTALALEQPGPDTYGMLRTYQSFGDPALVIDLWSAVFPSVTVNGSPWQEGTRLTAPSFTDSVAVEAVISDDVDLSTIEVKDGGTTLPPERVQIVRPPADQQGAQTYRVAFKTVLHLGNYNVTVNATDWAGRTSTLALPVQLDIAFSSAGRILDPQGSNTVDPDASVVVQVTNGVPLDPSAFSLAVDGNAYTGFTPEFVNGSWRLEIPGPWSEGAHSVEVGVGDAGAPCEPGPCPIRQSVDFTTSTGALTIQSAYFYPNPLESVQGTLVYSLNRDARRVQVSIYTVRGRRVLREEAPAQAGLNAFRWDLRDERGDRVANGIYLAVLRITGDQDEVVTNASDPIRIAVTR